MVERNLPAAPGTLNMTVDYESLKQRLYQLQQFVKEYMVPGEDYGIIEGSSKPALMKSGAEKLCDVYGLSVGEPKIEYFRDDSKSPVYISYRVMLPLISRADGRLIMYGVGSCNSWEKKYRYRWVFENELPPGMNPQNLKSRRVGNQQQYVQYQIPNDEVDDLDNTILKMAKKRAFIDAVLSATRSSAIFTQDVDDMEIKSPDNTKRYEQRQQKANGQNGKSNGNGMTGHSTENQQNAIKKIANQKGLNEIELDAIIQGQFGCGITELSKQDASNAIKLLQDMSADDLKEMARSYFEQPTSEEEIDIPDDKLPF